MGSPYRFNISEKVRGRQDPEDSWRICIVVSRYIDNDSVPMYHIQVQNSSNTIFEVEEFNDFIRKYIEKPIDHIKQSIEFDDEYEYIDHLIIKNKLDLNVIYRDLLET